ncbi:MAG: endolytic transglycosylase MltG [Austwickia sp.]|nr:endolytic transglycosylase MltG [Austwickia sp.]MCO5310636.1 endolytic transglycosylase MltG [Austwickia sp.]
MPDPLDEHIFGRPAEAAQHRPRRPAHRPRRRRRGPLTLLLVVALLVVAVWFAYTNFRPLYDRWAAPKDYPGEGTGSVTVVVKPGDTGAAIAQTLVDAGVVMTAEAFTDALASTKGDEIQPGTYPLKKEMRASAALSALRGGNRDVWRVTIREGLWKSEVYAALAQATGLAKSDYEAVEKQSRANPALLGLPPTTQGNPEGWLFPATYTFDKGSKPVDQMKAMVANTKTRLAGLGVADADAERVLTVASLVEAEARREEDRPKVARVLENRLAMTPPMPLQLDSTAAYGVQQRPGKVFTSDEMRAAQNPYNTYAMTGLPAAPIGSAGESAIKAAVNPATGTWLYFVTINPTTGETVFTNTLAEHEAQVAKLRDWCAQNSAKC